MSFAFFWAHVAKLGERGVGGRGDVGGGKRDGGAGMRWWRVSRIGGGAVMVLRLIFLTVPSAGGTFSVSPEIDTTFTSSSDDLTAAPRTASLVARIVFVDFTVLIGDVVRMVSDERRRRVIGRCCCCCGVAIGMGA